MQTRLKALDDGTDDLTSTDIGAFFDSRPERRILVAALCKDYDDCVIYRRRETHKLLPHFTGQSCSTRCCHLVQGLAEIENLEKLYKAYF